MRHDRGRPSLCGRRHRPIVDAHRARRMADVRFTITVTMAAGSARRFPELDRRRRCWLTAATWLNVMRTMRCGRRVHSVHHFLVGPADACERRWRRGRGASLYGDRVVPDNALITVVVAPSAVLGSAT